MRKTLLIAACSALLATALAAAPAEAKPAPSVAKATLHAPSTVIKNQIIMLEPSIRYDRTKDVQELVNGAWTSIPTEIGDDSDSLEVLPNSAKVRSFRVYSPATSTAPAAMTNTVTVRLVKSPHRLAKQISTGGPGESGCVLTRIGQALCWGDNTAGSLGDGTTKMRLIPVPVKKLATGNRQIKNGSADSCVITKSRTVKCWGDNSDGMLGDGTTKARLTPVAVKGLKAAKALVVAGDHNCALTTAGVVWCWGSNQHGHLGDQTTISRHRPVRVLGLPGRTVAISGGYGFSCALSSAGAVRCWGENDQGELGDGTTTDRSTAVAVSGLTSGVVAINSDLQSTCALFSSGTVSCWGTLSIGTVTDGQAYLVPTAVPSVTGLKAIGVGDDMACGLTTAGGVECWGARNDYGELGHGQRGGTAANGSWLVPGTVTGLDAGVTSISVKGSTGCAVLASGAAKCWGWNQLGTLGNGGVAHRVVPTNVAGLG